MQRAGGGASRRPGASNGPLEPLASGEPESPADTPAGPGSASM